MRRFVAAVLLLCSTALQAAEIEGLRLWRAPDHTRVVFDLSGPVEHKLISLPNPDRLVVDIPAAKLKADPSTLAFKETPITRIRHATKKDGTLRVVFDLKQSIKPRSFSLRATSKTGDRLVIDFYDTGVSKKVVPVKHVNDGGRRDIVVAIDAGHGGEDPGASGPNRLREKQVVLAISRELEKLLKDRQGFKPVMIRTGDYYVGLKKRRELARDAQADLLVSIHADAFKSPKARGTSVYALSQRGASSAMAKFLATSENEADMIGGVQIEGKDNDLVKILTDLSMTASLDASLKVGKQVLGKMGSVSHLHSRRVEQAAFAVLKSPDIPSILVETGFISNPGEAKKLATRTYQRKMAKAIFTGLEDYFVSHPPPDTFLAWQKQQRRTEQTYVIARGDTLSGIAKRYNVTIAELRKRNQLADSRIRIGQKLKIPAS